MTRPHFSSEPMSHKRKQPAIEVVDLTGSSPAPAQRARLVVEPGPEWTQREAPLENNDEAGVADDIIVPARAAMGVKSCLAISCMGSWIRRLWASSITMDMLLWESELVLSFLVMVNANTRSFRYVVVRRQPENQYDSNAIAIENVQRDKIGHIPRTVAAKLARYMDNNSLLVEGSLAGNMGQYDCPLELKLFGSGDPVERANLRSQMKHDRLPCQVVDQREKEPGSGRNKRLRLSLPPKRLLARVGWLAAVSEGSNGEAGNGNWTGMGLPGQSDGLVAAKNLDDIMETAEMFNPRNIGNVG